MATIQERLSRMKQEGQTAAVRQRLDRMKRDGQAVQPQKPQPVGIAEGQGEGPSLQAVGKTPALAQGRFASELITPQPSADTPLPALVTLPRAGTGYLPEWASAPSLSPLPKGRGTQDIQTELDQVGGVIGELKQQQDALNKQAGQFTLAAGSGLSAGDVAGGTQFAQRAQELREQAKELGSQIARLENNRAGLQSQWDRADQIEFDLRLNSDKEYQAAVRRAMDAPLGQSVDSGKPSHRDVSRAMSYFQSMERGDEGMAALIAENTDMALNRMSDGQRNRLAWYVGVGDYDGAAEFLNRIMPGLNQEEAKGVEQRLADWSQEHPVQGAAVNVVSWPFNIPAYLSNAGQAAKNIVTGKDERNSHLSANLGTRIGSGTSQGTQAAAREAATQAFGSETAGDVASFLVGTGLSIGQNVSQIAMLGPASLAGMSLSAAGSATQDVLDRGGTPQQAFLVGTSSGAIEAITEKIPLDNLFRLAKEGGGQGVKATVKELLKQMGTEATEEMISELANNLVDAAVMGNSSEYQMYVRELQEAGLPRAEAEQTAFKQFYLMNVLAAGAGGALSGGVMSGGALAFNRAGRYVSQLSGEAGNTQRTADAIDRAYQAMAERGMFSPEAGQAVGAARGTLALDKPLLHTGQTLRDAREGAQSGVSLPTAEQGSVTLDATQNVPPNPTSETSSRPAQFLSDRVTQGEAEVNGQQNGPSSDTEAQTAVLSPEEQRRQEIRQVVQALRESYARGDITEEGFDGALDMIMEQEGFAGIDMLMEPSDKQGGVVSGAEAEQLSGGREGRTPDQGARGQAGVLAEGGPRGPADTSRAAIERQNHGQTLRLQAVSARELGISTGTDAKNVRVLPEDAWDGELREAARKARRETGKSVQFVLGGIQVTGSDGAVHYVRGAYTQDGIIVQADHMRVSPAQIADHEIFHDYAQRDPGLIQAVEEAIVERYGQEEMDRIVDSYLQGLRGVVDMPEAGTDLEYEQALEEILNEMFADAYAGINAFGSDAGKYQGEVLDMLESRGVEAVQSRENAQAVDQRTGPPGEQFSYEGRTEDGIEVYETSAEIRSLPYKQRINIFLNLMRNEYKGRTAKFTVNDGEAYYARFSGKDLGKNIYGDKRSSAGGLKAKVNVGADGGVFELVENAQYVGGKAESGKRSRAHSGVASWDYFVKTVQIDGQVYDLVANVRKKPDGEYVYSIQLNESTKKAPAPSLASSRSENGDAQNRMLTGASEKSAAVIIGDPSLGADRSAASGFADSIAQSGADVKGWGGAVQGNSI